MIERIELVIDDDLPPPSKPIDLVEEYKITLGISDEAWEALKDYPEEYLEYYKQNPDAMALWERC